MEKVSVIVPVYNVENYLSECIDSILNQTYKNLEIILVDDGSRDNSGKICNNFQKKDDRIKVFHKKNGGVSSARNLGLINASGKFVCFIDSDDYLEKNYVEILMKIAEEKCADMVICSYFIEYKRTNYNIENELDKKNFLKYMTVKGLYGGYLWNKIYRLSILKDSRGDLIKFDETINIIEDLLYNAEISRNLSKIFVVNDALYHYRMRENSLIKTMSDKKEISQLLALPKIISIYENLGLKSEVYNFKLQYIYYYQIARYDYKMTLTTENFTNYKKDIKSYKGINYDSKLKKKVTLLILIPRICIFFKNLKKGIIYENSKNYNISFFI